MSGSGAARPAQRLPTQQRSRERFERILASAAQLLVEKGSEHFRMSDVVERSGVPFGSLYQYFPDKTAIIGTLAERYDEIGRACIESELGAVETAADLKPALCRIVDGYYRMFAEAPVMRDIWQATQADRTLQVQDAAEGLRLAGLMVETMRRIDPDKDAGALMTASRLIMTLIAATIRDAITQPPDEAVRSIALFKEMLPDDLFGRI